MRTINKGLEPPSLAEHRSNVHANYENYPGKDFLRASLIREQRGLCCYCLSRIPGAGGMKIEHWHSQDRYPNEDLNYANLLAACPGNQGQSGVHQHCDTRKGNRDLSRNPANPMDRVGELVHFEGDGRIVSHDLSFDAELNDVLNLNFAFLRANRKAVLNAFKDGLQKRGPLPRAKMEKWLQDWNGELHSGELRAFCDVVVYWLRKRLARP